MPRNEPDVRRNRPALASIANRSMSEKERKRIMKSCLVVTSDGSKLHSESFGSPGDPAVLLIMGATASGRWWPDDFCRKLADSGMYVIRSDHRDTGESRKYPAGEPGYSLGDLAADAIAVLDAHEIGKAHFVGMSLGGWLTQMLALTHPDRVLSVTLIASEPLASPDPEIPAIDPAVIAYHSAAGELDWTDRTAVVAFQTGLWRLLTGPERSFDADAVAAIASADFERCDEPLAMFNHAMLGGDPAEMQPLLDRLGEIQVPVLIVHGTHDLVLPYAHALRSAKLMPHARLLTLEGAGHELNRQDWPEIIEKFHTVIGQADSNRG